VKKRRGRRGWHTKAGPPEGAPTGSPMQRCVADSKQGVVLRRTSGSGDGAVEKFDDVQNFLAGVV
jgi:hypothetical protein